MASAPRTRLVVSLATIPSRIDSLAPVIDSIRAQTRRPDRVYVCICGFSEYEGRAYDVPSWLNDDPFVQVAISPRDYGPANKLLGVLAHEQEPTTRIVTVDDDWYCNPDLLEGLLVRSGSNSGVAVGLSGARLPRWWSRIEVRIGSEIDRSPPLPWRLTFLAEVSQELSVDVLQFGFGAMVQRGWFEDDIYSLVDAARPWYLADDVFLSGYLAKNGIERRCVAGMPLPRRLEQAQRSSLSGGGRMTARYREAIPALSKELGIWPRADLAPSFPRPTLRDLRNWARFGLREVRRTAGRRTDAAQ